MVVREKCTEPGCVGGKITLFTSVKNCTKCNGTGYITRTIAEYQHSDMSDMDKIYKYGRDQEIYTDDGNTNWYDQEDLDIW